MKKQLSLFIIPCGFFLLVSAFSLLCSVSEAASVRTQAGHVTLDTDQDIQNKTTSMPGANRMSSTKAVYVIQHGDTLYSVARKTTGSNRNWKYIAKYNDIGDPTKVWVGQKINIPAELTSEAETIDTGQSRHSLPTGATTPPQPQKQGTSHDDREQVRRLSDVPALTMKNIKVPTSADKVETGWIVIKGSYYPREINKKADPASDVLIQVWPGTRLKYFQRKDGWYRVNTKKGVGYVNPTVVRQE